MEHLSKQQIVLLTLLVSLVTSIATGITTVSLLDQAPQSVTQTINRVVERTIEKAIPSEPIRVPVKEVTTVIVKEEDQVIGVVEIGKKSIVRIKDEDDGALLGLGTILTPDGIVVADKGITDGEHDYGFVYNGQTYKAELLDNKNSKDSQVAFLRFSDLGTTTVSVAAQASTGSIKAGQTVVALTGAERDVVSVGIISSLLDSVATDDAPAILSEIDTTFSRDGLIAGTPMFNLQGQLVAVKAGELGSLLTINIVNSLLTNILDVI